MAAVMEGDEYVNELGLQVVIKFALCYEGESIKKRIERALKECNPPSDRLHLGLRPKVI